MNVLFYHTKKPVRGETFERFGTVKVHKHIKCELFNSKACPVQFLNA